MATTTHEPSAKPAYSEVVENMVRSTRATGHRVRRRADKGELIRICRGFFLEVAFLATLSDWGAVRAVELARIYALGYSRSTAFIVGIAAALMHGADPPGFVTVIDINCLRPGRSHTRTLPAVQIPGGVEVPAATVRFHRQQLPPGWSIFQEGVRTLTSRAVIVWIAMRDRRSQSFAAACTLLGIMVSFDTRENRIHVSRERERRELALAAEGAKFTNLWGALEEGLRFIAALTGACAAGGECEFLWLLHTHGIHGFIPQYWVICGEERYRCDFVLPGLRLIIEFDGWGKYPKEGPALEEFLNAQEDRARNLKAFDWEVIRFSSDHLKKPTYIIEEIKKAIAAAERRWGLAE